MTAAPQAMVRKRKATDRVRGTLRRTRRMTKSEKPTATDSAEALRLARLVEDAGLKNGVVQDKLWLPGMIKLRRLMEQGFFGDIVHGDCAYNTSKMANNFSKRMYWNMWWLRMYGSRKGNIYPTHGLGPIAQMMNINRGDQFDFLVSVESKTS